MELSSPRRLARLVGELMEAMHRYDAGRTLPLLHGARLSTPQLAVLEFLRTPRTVSAVAMHVGLSRPATSQMITKLVRRRLIRRVEPGLDRRERRVVLAAAGSALLSRIAAAREARFEAALTVLSTPAARRFEKALAKVVTELSDVSSIAASTAP